MNMQRLFAIALPVLLLASAAQAQQKWALLIGINEYRVNHWKLKDSYAFASVVANGPLKPHRCDKPTGETSKVAFLYPELGEISAKVSRNERLRQLAAGVSRGV